MSPNWATCEAWRKFGNLRRFRIRISASSASSDRIFSSGDQNSCSKKSVLFNLIRDVEPLDVSLIQKDVSNTTIDAMKRTISGMLGLLPSDQFQVTIDALWEPLSKLLISSMMTGYTLRNAEYRLTLERNLEICEGNNCNLKNEDSKLEVEEIHLKEEGKSRNFRQESLSASDESEDSTCNIPDFGEMTPEARRYVLRLYSRLSSVKKELHEVKRKSAALQMQQFVGEEENDLLDYLRSLQPEKVAELSEPTSPESKDTIHSVVHGLLATLSPKMHSKGPHLGNNSTIGTVEGEIEGDCIDLVENTSLQFQPLISLPRDYLARLLFWCMLLGHYLRGLEYRLELMDLLSLPCSGERNASNGEHSV
ncbi:MAR-binding filament-like protein [Perilla frutescens var. hirtella]|uniref:MAR-binding filament-like protein n=1 Tax=Perilla frutescens var. hirtella TaxID=608512 RepID=A0AAD4JGT9_PERFH|nr:MAR-binding filament-like protein [Perilla frutescens var. hirtella]